ncbi:MAG: FAD binding domain-containing protein [bacterium]
MLRGVREYFRAKSLDEAVRFLGEHGENTHLLAGGTDLLLVDRAYDTILDISRLDLDYIREETDELAIGATTSIETISRSPLVQSLADGILCEACHLFGTYQIRNMATIGGNVANAMPAADPPSALLALDARAVALGPNGSRREMALAHFFTGPRTTILERDELLVEIRLPLRFRAWRGRWRKIGRVTRDIAIVNAGVSARIEAGVIADARVALCAVAPRPLRITEAENLLRGKAPSTALFAEAGEIVKRNVRPISDLRAGEAYRRHVSGVIVRRALAEIAGIEEA